MTDQPGASAPTPGDEHDVASQETLPGNAPPPPQPRLSLLRRFGWGFAGLGVLALIGLSAYLIVVSREWSARTAELTLISRDLGQQVADAEAAKADAEARLAAARLELDNATSRISDLANEEAHANDRESVLIDYVDAMISCADSRQELIDVLTDSRLFFPGKTTYQVEKDVTAFCDGVSSDFSAFKEEIGQ